MNLPDKHTVYRRDFLASQPSVIDKAARTVRLTFSSDSPIPKGGYTHKLSHAPGAADLDRLNNGGAVLWDHNTDKQVGVVERATTDGRQGNAVVRFSKSDLGDEVFKDVLDGVRRGVSFGYTIDQYEPPDKNGLVNVTKWTPMEISVVAIPADPSVGINLSSSLPIMKPEDTDTNAKPEDEKPPAVTSKPETRAAGTKAKDSRADEIRASARTIYTRERGHAETHDIIGLAERAVETGLSHDDFLKQVRGTYNGGTVIGAGPEIVQAVARPSLGRSFTESPIYQRAAAEQHHQRGGTVLLRVPVAYEKRDTFLGGSLISVEKAPGVVPFGVQMPTVAALMQTLPTNAAVVRYTKETHFNPTAGPTGPGQLKPELDVDYADVDAPVVKIAVRKKISDEILWDQPAVAEFIQGRLSTAVDIAEDNQLLNGDGSVVNGATTMVGLLQVVGLLNQSVGSDSPADALAKAMTRVSTTAFLMPDAWVFNPNTWLKIKLLKDANNQYLGGGPFYAPYGNGAYVMIETLWGKPVVQTTAMPMGMALTGAFGQAAHPRRRMAMMVEMTNSNSDDFDRNLISVRAESRLGLTIEVPQAFCQVTGL